MEGAPDCPSCAGRAALCLGKLPAVRWFSGKRLTEPLAGGFLYLCQDCHLKFRHPAENPENYTQLYDNGETEAWPFEGSRNDWDMIAAYVMEQQPGGGKILDFGCYSGGLLARLGPGYERYGVEVNRAAAALASTYGAIWNGIEEIPAALRFDVVVVADVIEHVADPASLIRRLASVLSDDGLLVITTGDGALPLWNRYGARWWYCFYPEHIAFISREWLEWFLGSGRLRLLHCESFPYLRLSGVRRLLGRVSLWLYGNFGELFLGLLGVAKRIIGRGELKAVPGAGAVADHLFIVLTPVGSRR